MGKYILLISAVYPPEPVVSAKLSADLYQALKADGMAVRVLHPVPTRPEGFRFDRFSTPDENEVTLQSYTCPQSSIYGRFKESFSFGKACAVYIKSHHQEIAVVYANAWPLVAQYRIVKATKQFGIPVAMHIQDVYPESLTNKLSPLIGLVLQKLLLPMDRYILLHSDKVIAISEKMKDYLIESRRIDKKNVSVVLNWQNEQEFISYEQKHHNKAQHEKFTFMYLGNMGPVAGVDLLIDAFSLAGIENTRLVIAGSGSMKEGLKKKAKNNVAIEFWDVPSGEVPEIQSQADVLLLPIRKGSAYSSIPSKLPAYMFSAKPIVGAMDEDCDTADTIREARCGVIVKPDNIEALASVMKEMRNIDITSLEEMGRNGQQYALAHYSKGANLENLKRIICVFN